MSSETNWITSRELLALWSADPARSTTLPEQVLRPALRSGLFGARAALAEVEARGPYGRKGTATDWVVPSKVWTGSGENSRFDLRQDTYTTRAGGIGYNAVSLHGLSFEREPLFRFAAIDDSPALEGGQESRVANRPGPPLDAARWSAFAAALAYVADTEGIGAYPSRMKLYEAVAGVVSEKGGDPLDEKTVRSMLDTARQWAKDQG